MQPSYIWEFQNVQKSLRTFDHNMMRSLFCHTARKKNQALPQVLRRNNRNEALRGLRLHKFECFGIFLLHVYHLHSLTIRQLYTSDNVSYCDSLPVINTARIF